MKKIEVFGPGCPKCEALFENVKKALTELDMEVKLEKVTDIMEMIKRGVLGTPALAIDGEIKAVGKVLTPKEIKKILQES